MSFSARESSSLRFGRYEVLFRIAAGGMAEVYAARMVGEGGFEKPVALKRMLPTLAEDERFVQMFLDEGRLAAHISSPHVVQTLDLGRADDDSLYLVMELVVGVSLSALIRAVLKNKRPFPTPVAVEILAQAAEGLHDAHEARTMYGQPLEIVHRDISPQNILVDVGGRVRITDFGVARALERATHTQSGEVKGKIGYFAPEQLRGKSIDRRTDVFALGIVAWETLAGRRLFSGDNPAQTLDMVMSMPVPRLDALRGDVPKALADAVAHALERDPDQRTPSAGDFADALRRSMRASGPAGVGELVRSQGGESLMKLEDGLRSQSPSSASRVRRASSGDVRKPAPVLDEEATSEAGAAELEALMASVVPSASELAPTRPEVKGAPPQGQPPTQILAAPSVAAAPAGSARTGAPSPFDSPFDSPAPAHEVPIEVALEGPRRPWLPLAIGAGAIGALLVGGLGVWALTRPAVGTGMVVAPTVATAPVVTPVIPAAVPAPATSPVIPAAVVPLVIPGAVVPPVIPSGVAVEEPVQDEPASVAGRRVRGGRIEPRVRLADPRGAQAPPTTPETTRPETTRPETTRPETTRPETTRPETTRPETRSGSSSGASAGGRTGLVGVSDFEREIGQ